MAVLYFKIGFDIHCWGTAWCTFASAELELAKTLKKSMQITTCVVRDLFALQRLQSLLSGLQRQPSSLPGFFFRRLRM